MKSSTSSISFSSFLIALSGFPLSIFFRAWSILLVSGPLPKGKNEAHRPSLAYDMRPKEAVAMEDEALEAFRFACYHI